MLSELYFGKSAIDGGFFSSEEKTNNRIILVFGVYRATTSYFNILIILVARFFSFLAHCAVYVFLADIL